MKLLAFLNTRPGDKYGDVVSFHRPESSRSVAELDHFLPFPVDITVPCGGEYDREMKGKCGECEDNSTDTCDVQKYCRGEWSEGELLDPPTLVAKRRYRVDIDANVKKDSLDDFICRNKTAEQRQAVLDWAAENEFDETVFIDKVVE